MTGSAPTNIGDFRNRLKSLYEGDSSQAHRFRYGLLIFDIATLGFIVATSFIRGESWIGVADVAFGLIILADLIARLIISDRPLRELLHPVTWADAAAIISFLAPLVTNSGPNTISSAARPASPLRIWLSR